MKSLKFYSMKQRCPEEGARVFYVDGLNLRYCTISYIWEEVDEHGLPTGTSCAEDPGGWNRVVLADDCGFNDDTLWAYVDDLEEIIDSFQKTPSSKATIERWLEDDIDKSSGTQPQFRLSFSFNI